jgi:putative resolvase
VDARTAETLLGVKRKTLIRWAEKGYIVYSRPNGRGKWLFDVSSVGVSAPPPGLYPSITSATVDTAECVKVIYARVSTRKQLDDLKAQAASLSAKYPDHLVITDCGSGLNFKRKGLLSLLQLAFERRLQLVRITHRDRLCRFAYDLVEHILRKHGAEIHVEAHDLPPSAERELAEDVLSVITVFGARLHGARSAGRRGYNNNNKHQAEKEVEEDKGGPK